MSIPLPKWKPPSSFYLMIWIHSIVHLLYYFVNLIFNPQKYKRFRKIVVPPFCLSAEENGLHQYVKLSSSKYHYVERGNRNNPLLLLIHGYPEFWYSWRYQLRSLSFNFWVIALDLKGFGDSDKPKSQSEYDIQVLIGELHDFLIAIGRDKCSLVTHGLGGLVGWYFLNEYPETVENFISIASPHPIIFMQELVHNRVHHKDWYFFSPVPYIPEKEAMKNELQIFDKLFKVMLISKRFTMTGEDLEAYKYTFSRTEDWVGPINYFRTLLLRQNKYSRQLKKSHIPVLFIIGNSDPYISLEMICKSSEFVENFSLKIVEDAGHFLNQEMPNYVNGLILNFLKIYESSSDYDNDGTDRSILRKVFGAGKNVMSSTVNYGNQVWSTSKDAVEKGYNITKKLTP